MKQRGKRAAACVLGSMMLLSAVPLSAAPVSAAEDINYAKALQMSLYFYECQQAGKLPDWNRVEWKGDSNVDDDVDGGWYDAGDHVKFNLPMSYSAAMLAWGLYEYGDGVEACGEMTNYVNNLKWVLDYLAACDLGDSVIYQVGNGKEDHRWWGPVELYEYGMEEQGVTTARGHLEGRDCSAVTAEMGAALAAGYCALKGKVSQSVLDGYLEHAVNYFKMADADRSDATYKDSDGNNFYPSSHFYDELFWCANWLYIATQDKAYLDKAKKDFIPNLGKELGQDVLKYSWCQCWDDVQQGGTLLYAINTGDAEWIAQAKKHLDYWLKSNDQVPGGLRYVGTWGCLRYATGIGFLTAVACDKLFKNDSSYSDYKAMYEKQISFCFGDNPEKQVYVVGYCDGAPHNPHHRTAHGSWKNAEKTPADNRHMLYGALVGGPTQTGSYEDDRSNYINNEVATDYNAAYTALLCKMVSEYGGKTDPTFPYPDTRDDELYVEASVAHTASGSTVHMRMTNHTAWPARVVDNLSMRYYMDLSELTKAGVKPEDVVLRCDRDQSTMYSGVTPAKISGVQHYDGDIYYIEITFPDGRAMLPISEGHHQCEIILALVYPNYGSGWDGTNDYSAQGLTGDSESGTKTKYIPVYENGTLVYGIEPDGTEGKGSISASPAPGGSTNPVTSTESTTTTTTTSNGTQSRIHYGDVDCNGMVELADGVAFAKAAASVEGSELSVEGKNNADLNADNSVGMDDLGILLKLLAGIYTEAEMPIKAKA